MANTVSESLDTMQYSSDDKYIEEDLMNTNKLEDKYFQSDINFTTDSMENAALPLCSTDDCTLLMTVDDEYTLSDLNVTSSRKQEIATADLMTPNTLVEQSSNSLKKYYDYLDRYSWDWSEKIELKNGHLLYMIYKAWRDSVQFYQENRKSDSKLRPKSAKQCMSDVVKKLSEYLPQNGKSVGMKLRRLLLTSKGHKGCLKREHVEFFEKNFFNTPRKSKAKSIPPENAEPQTSNNLPVMAECSRCAIKQNDRKSLLKFIKELQVKLRDSRQTLREVKDQYSVRRVNKQMKRKNNIIAKCKKDSRELKAKNFHLRQENRKLEVQNELMENLKRKN